MPTKKQLSSLSGRLRTGVKGLDPIIGGGFERKSIVLLTGGPGTGKTLFSLQFLMEGARNGEKGLYLSFEETPQDLIRDAEALGWSLKKYVDDGIISIKYLEPFTLANITDHLDTMIKKDKIERLVIDSTSVFGLYLDDIYKIRKQLYMLAHIIKLAGVTAIFTAEIGQETPLDSSQTGSAYSRFGVEEYVADSVLLLHYAGLGGGFDRTLQVLKMRRTDHKRGLFPMKITDKGVVVNPSETV